MPLLPALPLPIITPRLIIRLPQLSDAAEIFAAEQKVWPELQKWMSWASDDMLSLQAVENFLRSGLQPTYRDGYVCDVVLVGFCRFTSKFVISSGLHDHDGKTQGAFSTGYWVAPEFLGQGLATEATNAVIRFGFEHCAAQAIHINYYANNLRSKSVIDKLGFTYLHTVKNGHQCHLNGELMDKHYYELCSPMVLPPLDVSYGEVS